MAVVRRHLADGAVGREKLSPALRKHKSWYEPFAAGPIAWDGEAATADGAPSATVLHVNRLWTGFHTFEYSPLATAADSDAVILAPVLGSEGAYEFGGDQTLGDGFELNFGGVKTTHPRVYLTGRESFYARLRLSIEDVSGLSMFFGFRGGATIQAVQAAVESYTDVFGITALGDSASAAAPVQISHCLTGDATDSVTAVATANTLADGTVYDFEVRAEGLKARFFINNIELLNSPLSTALTTARYFTPIFRFTHVSQLGGQVKLWLADGGLLEDRPNGLLTA
jgi:hypothetical protein